MRTIRDCRHLVCYMDHDRFDCADNCPDFDSPSYFQPTSLGLLLAEREMMLDVLSEIHDNIFRGIEPIVDRNKLTKVFEILRKERKKK